ncbi:MAG: molybdate ABC transporter substrate-binding protein [Gammaproteobacteria bacterium]|nr:molybdate ABC transporter substrate-binding protein [Gammaproteobacteria bacterium]
MLFPAAVSAADVRVAVAANFLSTLQQLQPLHQRQTGDSLLISSGSSAKLYAQIVNGAPFEVFLSADTHYPELLEQQGKAVRGSRFVYATGQLVLVASDRTATVDAQSLRATSLRRLALANPLTAPYGMAAQQVLQHLGLWQTLTPKLVRGESVAQAYQFVATGNAQLGFVALSQVQSASGVPRAYWLVPADYYSPLQQGAVLLTNKSPAAQRFLNFLQSAPAQQLIRQAGYR